MHVLDENFPRPQRALLERWRIHVRQVGFELARKGTLDENVLPVLHRLRRVTFFTRDEDYDQRDLRHPRYCLVFLDVDVNVMAERVRRFLRHRSFRTWAQRQGCVIRVCESGMFVWRPKAKQVEHIAW
jgi:hypothetical protein